MNRSKFGCIVLSVSDKKHIHEILSHMGYHTYDPYPPECPKRMWSKHTATMNCPDDDAWKRFVQKHQAEYARIFFEEYEKHKKKRMMKND